MNAWINAQCTSAADTVDLKWRIWWILFREYYRKVNIARVGAWDAYAASAYGSPALLSGWLAQDPKPEQVMRPLYQVLSTACLYGWDGSTCKLDQSKLGCLAYAYASADSATRASMVALLKSATTGTDPVFNPPLSCAVGITDDASKVIEATYMQVPMFPKSGSSGVVISHPHLSHNAILPPVAGASSSASLSPSGANPPWMSQACAAKLSDADKFDMGWRIVWVVGREYYRVTDKTKIAGWDSACQQAYTTGVLPDPTSYADLQTAATPLLSALSSQYLYGWDNTTCAFNQASLACLAFDYFNVPADRAPILAALASIGKGGSPDMSKLQSCTDTAADPIYTQSPPFPAAASSASSAWWWIGGIGVVVVAAAVGVEMWRREHKE